MKGGCQMKRINKNIIATVAIFLLIIAGFFSKSLLSGIRGDFSAFSKNAESLGFFPATEQFTSSIEKTSARGLSYYEMLMNINSVASRIKGVEIVKKDDSTVVLTEGGYLANVREYVSDEEIEACVDELEELCEYVEDMGAELLYVLPPVKGYDLEYPENADDFTKTNFDRFADELSEEEIPTLDLISEKEEENISDEEMFFITDHHWKPREGGLWAAGEISEELGLPVYNEDDFDITEYEDAFLGSQGKKVGGFFSPLGIDDIEILTPEFETSLREKIPSKGTDREGSFSELLYMSNIEPRDLYSKNPYAAYSGGDFREQIIINNKNPDGEKIVIIRDSFGCALTPFLSLSASELHILDIRDGGYAAEKPDVRKYIAEVKPDYVLILYSGVANTAGQFDF